MRQLSRTIHRRSEDSAVNFFTQERSPRFHAFSEWIDHLTIYDRFGLNLKLEVDRELHPAKPLKGRRFSEPGATWTEFQALNQSRDLDRHHRIPRSGSLPFLSPKKEKKGKNDTEWGL
jgi:5-methylcytosine-specific restriction endonuclease McrA